MPIHTVHLLGWDFRVWTLLGELPFLLLVLALFEGGRRRGWPWRSSALAAAAFVAGLGLGTALLPSVLGAVAGGVALWFAAQKVLRLHRPPVAVLALGLTALIAVGRWGCLLNGCCFGRLTDLPWAVHYDASTYAYFLHRSLGLLAADAQTSLAVHPYPAYESLGLLAWLPLACWLARRLRSECALLALTAAYDLALRGFIDGTRAMVNVWWGLLGGWLGLNWFQWVLLAGALMAALLGWQLERRARAASGPASSAVQPSSAVVERAGMRWLVYLGLCAVGWVSNSHQTVFLHRALLLALAGCVPALALPRALPHWFQARAWTGYVLAGLCLVLLGLHMENGALADGAPQGGKASLASRKDPGERTWRYEVDYGRRLIVRVGDGSTEPRTIEERERLLGLPVIPAAEPPPGRSGTSATWVGLGLAGGSAENVDTTRETIPSSDSGDGCESNSTVRTTTTTTRRHALGGWGQLERAIRAPDHGGAYWLGGRAGMGHEQSSVDTNGVLDDSKTGSGLAYYGNLWAEYEDPSIAFGLAGVVTHGPTSGTTVRPGGHLRVGSPRLGLDLGYADRASYLGMQTGHAGLSIAIAREGEIRRLDDIAVRLFVGAQLFPGTDARLFNVGLGVGAETYLTPRLVLGIQGVLLATGVSGSLNLRAAFGD